MDEDDRVMRALDATRDFNRQQITFAAILLSLTISFHALVVEDAGLVRRVLLGVSWVLMLSSIAFGLMAFGRHVHKLHQVDEPLDTVKEETRRYDLMQSILLAVGVVCLMVASLPAHFGW